MDKSDIGGLRVAVAMSGGVDSSIAAMLLVRQGFRPVGLTMQLDGLCGGPGEAARIERVRLLAIKLGIEHHVLPMAAEFNRMVLAAFRREYRAGRTPNPCVVCNRFLKFDALVSAARARGIGFSLLATGHYARIQRSSGGRFLLMRACDKDKDQSYFLFRLTQEQLAAAVFPVGAMLKREVRALAGELGLAELKESSDFAAGQEWPTLFADYPPQPGPVFDTEGRELGRHYGIEFYTVGQRKGLGLGGGTGEPLHVLRIDPGRNALVVAPRSALFSRRLMAIDPAWIAIEILNGPLRVQARIRHRHVAAAAMIRPAESAGMPAVEVVFDQPQFAVTPGQAVVFYDGDIVIGGGTIAA